MIGYRFLAPADQEMTEAAVFYEIESPGLGVDFLNDLQLAVDTLRAHPSLGAPVGRRLRRGLLHRFPFSLIYVIENDEMLVVAVAHEKRRPDYWRDRIG